MSLANNLREKGIIVTEFESRGNDYRNQWVQSFFESINEKRPFLWELFHLDMHLNVTSYIDGKEANKTFDKVNKQYCYIFFQESNDLLKVEFASAMKARELLNELGEYSDVFAAIKDLIGRTLFRTKKGYMVPIFIGNNYEA